MQAEPPLLNLDTLAQALTASLADVQFVGRLCEGGVWMPANMAQNALYHHLHRSGKDVRTVPSFSPCGAAARHPLP